MSSLLFGISLSALLSVTSLLIVLFRVSPLLSPTQAIPAFLLTILLSVCSVSTLLFIGMWQLLPVHWDAGKVISISMRQGIFAGLCSITIVLFSFWDLLNLWIALMIVGVFVLVEMALDH